MVFVFRLFDSSHRSFSFHCLGWLYLFVFGRYTVDDIVSYFLFYGFRNAEDNIIAAV